MHTPIITASDAEGAGEMFRVTTLPFDAQPPRMKMANKLQRRFFWQKHQPYGKRPAGR